MGRFARLTIIALLGGLTPALAGAQTPQHVPVAQLVPEMIASGAVLAPGSFLVISHSTNDFSPEKMSANAAVADQSGAVLVPRSKEAILGMFNGRDLVDPGLVLVSYWRPEGGDPGPDADKAWVYGGVAAV